MLAPGSALREENCLRPGQPFDVQGVNVSLRGKVRRLRAPGVIGCLVPVAGLALGCGSGVESSKARSDADWSDRGVDAASTDTDTRRGGEGAAGASDAGHDEEGVPAPTDGSASGAVQSSGEGDAGAVVPAGSISDECAVPRSKLVRLSFHQQANAVEALFGETIANQVRGALGLEARRAFPPLLDVREGVVVGETQFAASGEVASLVGKFVLDNFDDATHCGEQPERLCAEAFVINFAQRATRKPIDAKTTESLLQVVAEVLDVGGSVQQAVQYSVEAILNSPSFLYRTEFGPTGASIGQVQLTSYELASALSFFLTDGPPDDALLTAAADDSLTTREGITAQVDRLLASDVARAHFARAMLDYFAADRLESVVLDQALAPEFDTELRQALFREVHEFMHLHLWKTPLGELLTTRESRVNARLAELYGIADFDPGNVDENGFAPVSLPEERAGVLTLAGLLTSRSRPTGTSVVGRGLWVRSLLLCAENPPFPEQLQDSVVDFTPPPEDASEREKAEMRATEPGCADCHRLIDPYGLALESFDLLGRLRQVDEFGRPIDTRVTLPAEVGGAAIDDATELAASIEASQRWHQCIAESFVSYALAEPTDDCHSRTEVGPRLRSDSTFADLIREITVSQVLSTRQRVD